MNAMFKSLIVAIICFISIVQIEAQNLAEAEVSAIMYRAFELQMAGDYSEALDNFLIVGENTKLQRTEQERQIYVISQTMACSCYYSAKQYNEGYMLAKKLISGKLDESEKTDVYHQYALNGCMVACGFMRVDENGNKDYHKARELLLEIVPYTDEQLKEYVLPKIPLTWYFEGSEYFESQKFDMSLSCFEKALEGYRELGMIENEISTLDNIAYIYYCLYDMKKSIENYEQALLLAQKINDEAKQMNIIKDLLDLNSIVGDMEQVDKYNILMNTLIENTIDIQAKFNYYIGKGKEARNQGNYDMAEQWFLKCKPIVEEQDENVVNENKYQMYSNLRDLYYRDSRYEEALEYATLTLDEGKKIRSDDITGYYMSYISIAYIYCKMDDKENCYRYLDSLFMVEPYLDEPKELGQLYVSRAICHNHLKNYEEAFADYKKADEILSSKYHVTDGDRTAIYSLIGGIGNRLGYYDESEYYYELYANSIKEIYGENSMKYIDAQVYLSNAQAFAGNIKKGCDNYAGAVDNMRNNIKARLPYMNAAERESFWYPLSKLLTNMTPYALAAQLYQTEYTKTCYDALLMSKAFLLESERSLYDIIKESGSESDMQIYNDIVSLNDDIKEWERDYGTYSDSILTAYSKMDKLETSLMKTCKSLGDITAFLDFNYKNVKNVLKKNEYLLDFTDFVHELQGRKYAAYIIDKKQKYPLLLPLFAESQIDSLGIARPDMFYDTDLASEILRLFWTPIEKHVKEGATIYYVPSQLFFYISLESLPLEDGTLLGDHYNFVRLSSARELVKTKAFSKSAKSSAVLYGGLQYDVEPELMVHNSKRFDVTSLMTMRGDITRGGAAFDELPGAKTEIEKIKEILDKSGFDVTSYSGADGTEESFLAMNGKSPQILHLATHGFYYTPSEAEGVDYLSGYNDAMLLSGLIMSGGNAAWQGKELPNGVLGGVLTANNIAHLDLSATDLVVLSACKSGQGESTSEGLYGLQRAFKKAGVGTMVMTLWSVSDKVATEFMINFYEELIENNWNKHKAFENAKAVIRQQYPDPYFWAAFIMLD